MFAKECDQYLLRITFILSQHAERRRHYVLDGLMFWKSSLCLELEGLTVWTDIAVHNSPTPVLSRGALTSSAGCS